MDRASRAAVSEAANRGRSVTTAQDRTCADAASAGPGSSKIGPNRGLPPPPLDLAGLGRGEGAGDDGPEHPGEADHVVATHHLEQAGLLHDRHLRAAGEEHPAAAPPEPVIDEVGAERPEVLGPRHRLERESAPA